MANRYMKMFNNANDKRNANQNYSEISLHTCQMAIINKSPTDNECLLGCGDLGTLVHC